MTNILQKHLCSGCSACFSICATQAITMQADGEGFLYPVIDQKKCTDCGICKKTCPVLNDSKRTEQSVNPSAYAAISNDEAIRLKSSSGGIFSLLAEYVFAQDGVVFGAAFDHELVVKHCSAKNTAELEKLRGSKYVQSQIGNTLIEAKSYLDQNVPVLFSGTPCQIAGLYGFLGKEYDNLMTVDLVCHGTPSPLVFDAYITELLQNKSLAKKDIESIQFRDKVQGWHIATLTIKPKNKDIIYQNNLFSDIFGLGFGLNLYLRPHCTSCIYSKIPRIADVTLGDYWGVDTYDPEMDDNKGTSLLLINNRKADSFFKLIQNKVKFKKIQLENAIALNRNIVMPSDKHKNRVQFFNEFKWSSRQCLKQRIDFHLNQMQTDRKKSVAILNFVVENFNYGAVLVSYALSKIVSGLGFTPYVIDLPIYSPQTLYDKLGSIEFYKFREQELQLTQECTSYDDLKKLNDCFDLFITGSDQVWRQIITKTKQDYFFLNFVDNRKRKIAYGASFGLENFDGDINANISAKKRLSTFDFVSVREFEGKEICKNLFNVQVEQVLDPTLLLEESSYTELINKGLYKKNTTPYIGYYFIGDFENKIDILTEQHINEFVLLNKLQVINLKGEYITVANHSILKYKSIYEWLHTLKNAELIITDSYHGVLFSIIFKKQFACIGKKSVALSRFTTLFSLFRITDRFFTSLSEIDIDKINKNPIDYTTVYKILDKERNKSLSFLKKALEKQFTPEEIAKKRELYEQERFEQLEQSYANQIEEIKNQLQDKMQHLENVSNQQTAQLQDKMQHLENVSNQQTAQLQDKVQHLENVSNQQTAQLQDKVQHLENVIKNNRYAMIKRVRTFEDNGNVSVKLLIFGMSVLEKRTEVDFYEWRFLKLKVWKGRM